MFQYQQMKYKNKGVGLPSNQLTTMDPSYPIKTDLQISSIAEPNIEYEETIYYLNVNSGDRLSTSPLHYDYSLNLPSKYENVKSAELISAIFPNVSGITDEPYLVVDIEELNTVDFTMQQNSHKGFSVCPLKNPNQASGGYVMAELACALHTKTVFKTPKMLSRLQIKIRDQTGNLYTFGDESGSGSTVKADQHSFVLKITTYDKSRAELNTRNTF